MPIANPLTYLSKIAEKAKVSGQLQANAAKIIEEAQRKKVSAGKDPMGLAAAALYISCMQAGEKKTQKDIAEAAGVTEVTVRNRYKTLKRQLDIDMIN
jgi:transcription initiation factor TFIIB